MVSFVGMLPVRLKFKHQFLLIGLMMVLSAGGMQSTVDFQTASAQADIPPEQTEALARTNTIPPKPTGLGIYINDYANLLSASDKVQLQQQLQALDEAGIAQVSVLILQDTDQELSDFAFKIMNQWGIQHYKKKDGLLVLVNANRVRRHLSGNRIFVATGYALEAMLPDALVGRVLDENALPAFERGDYSGGITQTVTTLTNILSGNQELRSKYAHRRQNQSIPWPAVIFIVIFILLFFRRRGGGPFGGGGFYGGGGYFGGFGGGGGFSDGGGFGGGGDSSGGGGSGR